MTSQIKLNKRIARKVLSIVDTGLVQGVGKPIAGKMCVEAAVCFALGLPHGDNPPCVGEAVRSFKIKLNDCNWSSDLARSKGMRKLAIAQLGSDSIDQVKFAEKLAFKTCRVFLPAVLRQSQHPDKYEKHALACESANTLEDCNNAANAAYAALSAAYAAYAAANAANAANAALSAAYAAYAAAYAAYAAYAANAALSAAYAALSAAYAAYAANAAADEWLIRMADIGLECLIDLKSPGCKWLDLCESK